MRSTRGPDKKNREVEQEKRTTVCSHSTRQNRCFPSHRQTRALILVGPRRLLALARQPLGQCRRRRPPVYPFLYPPATSCPIDDTDRRHQSIEAPPPYELERRRDTEQRNHAHCRHTVAREAPREGSRRTEPWPFFSSLKRTRTGR